jgi:phage repressor protein C with HTH and peptisase S24 domain
MAKNSKSKRKLVGLVSSLSGHRTYYTKKETPQEAPTEHHRVSDSAELHYHVRTAAPAPDGNEKLGLCLVDIPCESSYIPIFNATASMGSGRDLPEIEYQVGAMQLSHAWLRQHLNISHTNNLAVISADGDSMAPTFSSGDLLLIDRQVDQIKTDAIYALALDDQLYVKRLARNIGANYNNKHDNPIHNQWTAIPKRIWSIRAHVQYLVII